MRYFVDASGKYLGGWDQGGPTGGLLVDHPPVHASQIWDGASWGRVPVTGADLKLQGVEFQGVMCSATKEDMWGLSAIAPWVKAGKTTAFAFDNGNTLVLTPDNYLEFTQVWGAFRSSFFPVP